MKFFDTNILVYANTHEPKSIIAREVLREGGFISTQVIAEFAHVMFRKAHYSWAEINEALADIDAAMTGILSLTRELQREAFALSEAHQLSIYDSQIVAAAQKAKCRELISEDFQHGQRFGNLTVRNPFLNG